MPSDVPRTKGKLRSGEIIVSGDQFPIFLYQEFQYNPDRPWDGLFKSSLLVLVSSSHPNAQYWCSPFWQAYKHVFTSPSSVNKPKATRSGNARIHGMTEVTPASIAYIATQVLFTSAFIWLCYSSYLYPQVRFALSSSPVFSRTDTATDSETFYKLVLGLLEDVEEKEEVNELLMWWNRYVTPYILLWLRLSCCSQIFPGHLSAQQPIRKNSALMRIKQKRLQVRAGEPSA